MYSPVALPSSSRAAPAKKRSWSTIGTSSSLRVSPSGLPVFSRLDGGELVRPRLHRVGQLQQGQLAHGGRGPAPVLEGLGGGAQRVLDVLGAGDRRQGDHLLGDRVDDLAGLAADGVHRLAADDVAQDAGLHTTLLMLMLVDRSLWRQHSSPNTDTRRDLRTYGFRSENAPRKTKSIGSALPNDGNSTHDERRVDRRRGPAQEPGSVPGPGVQGDHRTAPAGRSAVLRHDRQGRGPVRGRGAPTGAAPARLRGDAGGGGHRPAHRRLQPAGDDRHSVRR